jgi:hypothetical protein
MPDSYEYTAAPWTTASAVSNYKAEEVSTVIVNDGGYQASHYHRAEKKGPFTH